VADRLISVTSTSNAVTSFVSAVVVATPGHLGFISECLQDIFSQTYPFSEVIIVASGFDRMQKLALSEHIGKFAKENLKVSYVHQGPAGRNRNIGATLASTSADLVFFHDADDRYSVTRNELVVSLHKKEPFDALVHFYVPAERQSMDLAWLHLNQVGNSIDNSDVVGAKTLFLATFPEERRNRKREELGLESTTLRIDRTTLEPPIHHAHVVVSKQVLSEVVFHEKYSPRNEDSIMLRDLLFSRRNIVVLCKPLSIWVKGTSSYTLQYRLRHFVLRIRQVLFTMGSRLGTK